MKTGGGSPPPAFPASYATVMLRYASGLVRRNSNVLDRLLQRYASNLVKPHTNVCTGMTQRYLSDLGQTLWYVWIGLVERCDQTFLTPLRHVWPYVARSGKVSTDYVIFKRLVRPPTEVWSHLPKTFVWRSFLAGNALTGIPITVFLLQKISVTLVLNHILDIWPFVYPSL